MTWGRLKMIAGLLDDGFTIEARAVLKRTLDEIEVSMTNEASGALPLLPAALDGEDS